MRHSKDAEGVTRRDFLKGAAYGTVSMAMGLNLACSGGDTPIGIDPVSVLKNLFNADRPVSRVVLIRREDAVDADHKVNAGVVAEMIDAAVKTLSGEKDTAQAWQHYVRPQDTVGIKYTRCESVRVHTEQAVIDAIVARLADAGAAKARIHANDYGLPLRGCTALINVPTIKVHPLTGIAVSLKNYINFTGRESSYHHEGSARLGEAWLLPDVKGKTRLIIVDALRPYFGPGPQVSPVHRWDYRGILAGTDPVAIDTISLTIAQTKRNSFKGEEWIISPPPKSIATADTVYHLGTSDPLKIQLIRQGWERDALV
jgi:hypothetical protein